jgi:hypothetical protein
MAPSAAAEDRMAQISLGMASPHAFGGGTPLAMQANRQKDSTDRRMDYASLLVRARKERPWLIEEVTDGAAAQRNVELLNWVIVAGAMEDREFTFLLDYMPSYRTEAGTGNGLAVGYWN